VWEDINAIKMHLIKCGFLKGYKTWSHNGEAESTFNNADIGTRCDEVGDEDVDENDHVMMDVAFGCEDQNDDQIDAPQVDNECDVDMEEMLHHIEPEVFLGSAKGLKNFETIKKAAKDRMYECCGKEWIVLCFLLHLLIVKVNFGWSDNSFNELLTLLANPLPKTNLVPRNTYEAKKIINPLKMRMQRIHTCRYHCILYRGDYAEQEKCPNCDVSRYKSNAYFVVEWVIASKSVKRKVGGRKSAFSQVEEEYSIGTDTGSQRKVPALVMWYLPVEDRLKRLFSNPKTAELMTWHVDLPEKSNGKLRHPSDAR
jgi:hypothetical protein